MTEGALPVNTFDIVWKRVPYNSSFITKGPGHHVHMCFGDNNAILLNRVWCWCCFWIGWNKLCK